MVTTRKARGVDEGAVMHVPSTTGKWVEHPVSGVKAIPLRGDMTTGAHACFTRFEAGADHGWHTHTHDLSLVVVKGAYLFKTEGGQEKRVAAGDYVFLPGGLKHWSGADRAEGCVFYQESQDAFDFNPID